MMCPASIAKTKLPFPGSKTIYIVTFGCEGQQITLDGDHVERVVNGDEKPFHDVYIRPACVGKLEMS